MTSSCNDSAWERILVLWCHIPPINRITSTPILISVHVIISYNNMVKLGGKWKSEPAVYKQDTLYHDGNITYRFAFMFFLFCEKLCWWVNAYHECIEIWQRICALMRWFIVISVNGSSPVGCQALTTRSIAELLSIELFGSIEIKIQKGSARKMQSWYWKV